MNLKQRIITILKAEKEPLTQKELQTKLPMMHRAILLGYLRALTDLGHIKSKPSGRSLIYYL